MADTNTPNDDGYTPRTPRDTEPRGMLESPGFVGIGAFVMITVVGAILGMLVKAATVGDLADMTIRATGDADGAFNWLIFSIFIAVGLLAGVIGAVGAQINYRLRAAGRPN